MIHCCEAPRSMLSNYFCKKQVLRGTFGEIWRIQIQIYLETYVELKYGACYLKIEVSAHRLGLVVQLSWRVAPPFKFIVMHTFFFFNVVFWLNLQCDFRNMPLSYIIYEKGQNKNHPMRLVSDFIRNLCVGQCVL